MSDKHELVQEYLAGAALHALDAGEQAEAEVLLAEHLPRCPDCSRAKDEFDQTVAELALAAPAKHPPRLLGTRLRKDIRKGHRPAWTPVAMVAAAVAVVVGLSAWNAHLSSRMSRAEARQAATQANTADLIYAVSHPESRVVPFDPAGEKGQRTQVAATYVPGRRVLYLFGSMPLPSSGHVYQVWLGKSGVFSNEGTFVPQDRGLVFVRIAVDPSGYDTVLVTEEPARGSQVPSEHRVVAATIQS